MKAVRYHDYGDESVLRYEEVAQPTPGPGQVLLRVAGTAFNPVDVALRAGYLRGAVPLQLPHVPGFDVSGTVVQVGEDVTAFAVDDDVVGFLPMEQDGAAAEYVVAPAGVLTGAPVRVPLPEAAALPSAGLTAWQALHEHLRLQAGQRLLVNGAGGAVGGYAVQLAKAAGAHVIAVAGPRSADRVRWYGADVVVDRSTTSVRDAVLEPVDAVLHLAPTGAAGVVDLVRPGGVAVTTVPGEPVRSDADVRVVTMFVRSDAEQLAGLVQRVDARQLHVWVSDTLSVGDLPAVHALSGQGRLHGKVVLVP